MALRGLAANKLRAALTMLGVIIGAAAVILAIAIGEGSRAAAAESIRRLGVNVLTIRPGRQQVRGIRMAIGSRLTLSMEDADAILKHCPLIKYASPQVDDSAQIEYQNENINVQVDGCGYEYPEVANHPVRQGRFFTPVEQKSSERVAVLGESAWRELFDLESPIGKQIHIAGQPFKVVGLLKPLGGQGRDSPDNAVYVPITTAMRRMFGMERIEAIICQVHSADAMAEAEKSVLALLKKRHEKDGRSRADFSVLNQASVAEVRNQQQNTFSALITWLAVVSLVVGGIGIMNIMLVSVTERTREIGIRKAIGAKRRHILGQFLTEALIISVVGGLVGIAGGTFGSRLVGEANDWQVIVSIQSVILAFGCSGLVGVLSGFYPAWRASRLNPIQALRHD
jgi:putative ABC transport system permease protein